MSDVPSRLSAALADRYRIERELGAGGMATVYLAEDLKHDRKVAIKVLKPELAAVLGAERFVTEIKTTAALQHPNILPLFDSGEAGGFLFYVMPYVEGETLRDRLNRERQLGVDEAVKLVAEVADALQYAHEHGVVHRDIKPENILLHAGRPMVADFGIALAVSAAAGGRMTETGLSLGTPHYMSPEQATAEKEITGRSDIYSLASVLYEMLAGVPPHEGGSAQQTIMRIIADTPRPVTELRKAVPPNVAAAVGKALEKLPADRFESAKAFAAALTDPHFGADQPAVGGSAAADRRWKRRFQGALAVIVVLLGAIAMLLWGRRAGGPGLEMSVEQKTFGDEAVLNARWAPDGRTIVYSAARTGTTPRLYIVRPEYPAPQAFGPDSIHLLGIASTGEIAVLTHARFLSHRHFVGTLARMSLGGGLPRDEVANVREADWSPDGSRLAIIRQQDSVVQLEYPAGRVLYRARPGGKPSDLRVSPQGDRVAFFDHQSDGDDRGTVMVVDTAGKATTLTEEFWGLEGLAWEPDGKAILFAGASRGGGYQVHRVVPGQHEQLVLPSPGSLTVQDISADGRWLVTREDQTNRIVVRAPGASQVEDLSWLDNSLGPIISDDGTELAFTDQSIQAGPQYGALIRKTDGSPVIRLGAGFARDVSRNKRWVIGQLPTAPSRFMLYPTGAGETRELTWSGLTSILNVSFYPDGRALFVCGVEPEKAPRCYRSPLDASSLEPVTPQGVQGGLPSPDGKSVVYVRGGVPWIYSAPNIPLRRLASLDSLRLLRWSPDGTALWVVHNNGSSGPDGHVESLDVATGRRTPLVTITLPGAGPLMQVSNLTLADDPRAYAYGVGSQRSLIFEISGVR